jgi:HEAT repeat protein
MGTWEKSPDDILFASESPLWDRYPQHVARAFLAVCYEDLLPALEEPLDVPFDEDEVAAEAIEAFVQRWGGWSDESFVRVLAHARDRDRLAAIFAIGHGPLPDAANVLAPCLTSPNILERYAAAIMLGLRRDERALPVLEEYLLADAPTVEVKHPRLGVKLLR